MTAKVAATYENGTLRLAAPLPLPENARVTVTVESEGAVLEDRDRVAWLKQSEAALMKAWNNPEDDVFNALLDS